MTHEIFIVDDQHPEDTAMLQALYSRSPASVVTHLEKIKESGSGKFMSSYYVGYGHSSIGDCATTTIFIEQVSMLVAKAFQDSPLYNGQEASTRYLDFSKQGCYDPYDHPLSAGIQGRWLDLYNQALPQLIEALQKKYPFDPEAYKSERIWSNALTARAFDIARGLLPMGTKTLLSWTTSLRHARDHLRRLKTHPVPEVRDVARSVFEALYKKYPNSFNGNEMAVSAEDPRDQYAQEHAIQNNYLRTDDAIQRFGLSSMEMIDLLSGKIVVNRHAFDAINLKHNEEKTLKARRAGTALPWRLESYGRYNFLFLLDFGSFRDIQRHRNAVTRMPLIDGRFGVHPWYMAQINALLPPEKAEELIKAVAEQFVRIKHLDDEDLLITETQTQYLYPMGTMGLVHVAYSLPEAVYVSELRSGKTVHSSLRPIAQKILAILSRDFPDLPLFGDMDEENWTAKRGEQTIFKKE